MTISELSTLIKNKRAYLKITQKKMAETLAISISAYNRIENGKQEPTFRELQLLCEILLIDLSYEFKIRKPNHISLYD